MLPMAAGGMQAYGTYLKGSTDQSMYNYKAGVAQANAALEQNQANLDLDIGGLRTTEAGLRGQDIISRTKTAFGAGNIDSNSGSAALVKGSELMIGQTNEKVAMFDAQHASYVENVKAASSTAEASADIASGTTSRYSGDLGAIASIIGTAGNVASKWMQAAAAGAGGSGGGGGGGGDTEG